MVMPGPAMMPLRAILIYWAEGQKHEPRLSRPCQLLQQRKLWVQKGEPKTVSSKNIYTSSTCAASHFPPPAIVTALLIIPKVCNNSNPNFEAFSCFEEDILSVGGGNESVFFFFYIMTCKTVQAWRHISNCCECFVVLDSVFTCRDNLHFTEVIICLSFFQRLMLKK